MCNTGRGFSLSLAVNTTVPDNTCYRGYSVVHLISHNRSRFPAPIGHESTALIIATANAHGSLSNITFPTMEMACLPELTGNFLSPYTLPLTDNVASLISPDTSYSPPGTLPALVLLHGLPFCNPPC